MRAKLCGSKSAKMGGVREVGMKLISRTDSFLLGAGIFDGGVLSNVAVPSKTISIFGAFES
jgi:hypothetical protein